MSNSFNRIYSFSDTYGGNRNPDGTPKGLLERPDFDVMFETHFGSPHIYDWVRVVEDVYGLPVEYVQHLVRLAVQLHSHADEDVGRTGIFINAAPRTRGATPPFYVLDLTAQNRASVIRAVSTSLEAFSPVRDSVSRVRKLPENGGGLHKPGEQFRSRFTPDLLQESVCERAQLEECDADIIPHEPNGWRIGWVDSFGNVITRVVGESAREKTAALTSSDHETCDIIVGGRRVTLRTGRGLEAATPGELTIYTNGNLDIVRKWGWGAGHAQLPDETHETRITHSAYYALGEPSLGTEIAIPS